MKKLWFILVVLFFAACGPYYNPTIIVRDIDPQSLHYDTPVLANGQMTPYYDSIYKMGVTWKQALNYHPAAKFWLWFFIGLGVIGAAVIYYLSAVKSKAGATPLTFLGMFVSLGLFAFIGYNFVDSYRNDNNYDHPIKKSVYIQIEKSGGDFSQFWDTIKLH